MALYELSDVVVKNLHAIVDNTTIKGGEIGAIIEIKNALAKPVEAFIPKQNDTPADAKK